MARYWIAVASHEHVALAVAGGFMQVCHGKPGPLNRMSPGDWVMYYSPTKQFGGKAPYRCFTAVGQIAEKKPYQFAMSKDFIPWRRDVIFISAQPAPIEPLLEQFSFVTNRQRWGLPFRRGCFEITAHDFEHIAHAMKANFDE